MAINPKNLTWKIFGIAGDPAGNDFMPSPCGASNANEMAVTMRTACSVRAIYARCRVAPGGAEVDTYTLRINGVGSAAAATITAAATTGLWEGTVAVAAGDRLSMQYTVTGGVATRDICASVLIYLPE